MPKAILEFNLDEPSEQLAHKRAICATDAYLTLYDFRERLFREIKRLEDSDLTSELVKLKFLRQILDQFNESTEKYRIDIDEDLE